MKVNQCITAEQMATRQAVRVMNEARIACFDTADLAGCVKDFVDESKFIVSVPGVEDVVFEGYAGIRTVEEGFLRAIAENFGGSYHELCEWRWKEISADTCEVHVLNKLWLLEKNGEKSGEWVQRDLGGPGGVYWFFINNKRIDGVWRTVEQHAIATSLVD